ncbi:hypothetical protein [Anatilimnocola aggregata]|nr:hypothetical protein [Anatilimnocola aggregata]
MMVVAIVPSRARRPQRRSPAACCSAFAPAAIAEISTQTLLKDDPLMRNLVFVALLATAALSMGCNGIHKRHGGCSGGACGGQCGHGGQCGGGQCAACGGHGQGGGYGDQGGGYAGQGGCGPGGCGGHGAHGGAGGHGGHGGLHAGTRGMHGVPHHFSREYNGPQGPQSAQVAYPYYTTRGPRDYFANNPPSIGN